MKPRILIVDDDAGMREVLTTALGKNWDVTVAENGNEALTRWMADHFDVVSTDMDMPQMNGLQLARAILDHSPNQVLFMLSGNDAAEELVMELGARGFYHKSNPHEYLKMLEAFRADIPEYCDCADCEDSNPCEGDCPRDEECRGCREAREEREEIEHEIDKAQGRR